MCVCMYAKSSGFWTTEAEIRLTREDRKLLSKKHMKEVFYTGFYIIYGIFKLIYSIFLAINGAGSRSRHVSPKHCALTEV